MIQTKFNIDSIQDWLISKYYQSNMKIQLEQCDHLTLDFERGGRIIQLVLSGVKIIDDKLNCQQLGAGSYLMFPWVNRLRKYEHDCPRKDANGYPIHGHCTNLPRSFEIKKLEDEISIEMKLKQQHPLVPSFTQIFTLKRGQLSIQFIVEGKTNIPYCFGYHPYFQINDQKLEEIQIKTDVKNQIKLDNDLLPIYPFQITEQKIDSNKKYDSLFHGGSYFKLIGKQGISINLYSSMNFWQVYTPDNSRIAIEPMSFCGNIYQICQKEKILHQKNHDALIFSKELPQKGSIKISVQNVQKK